MNDGFARTVGFYIGMYIRAQNTREKISWLWGANSMILKALRNRLDEDEVKQLEEFDKEFEKIFKIANWELFDSYKMGRFDVLNDQEYRNAIGALMELERIKNTLLQMLYKTDSLVEPFVLGSDKAL